MNDSSTTDKSYNPQEIEKKWQKIWENDRTFTPDLTNAQNPYFNLMMFPYPSAEGLHVGNMYAFTGADVHGRLKRMQGKDVFEPIGLDGFGIHSENYAMKQGMHPSEQAKISSKNFYRQLRATGNAYDWTRTLQTYDPDYYRWTQWLFIQMFRAGLAYRKKAQVNWCPSDKTVLADEQVIDGRCERDGAIVQKRDLEQWFFRITSYADRLLAGLDKIDWPEKIKIAQRQWIGKSEGAKIKFEIQPIHTNITNNSIEVFTTRPDTLWGVTFMVISPEHPLAQSIDQEEAKEYIKTAKSRTSVDRMDDTKEKTGVFSGIYAINPINGEKIPVWIADYVLMGYGTGAIMAVPAHDERDFAFAKKYNLPIKQVIVSDEQFAALDKDSNGEVGEMSKLPDLEEAYIGSGGLVNSGSDWNNYSVPDAMPKILDDIEKKEIGRRESNYHLRDWLISRQRYWGPPIPMIFCSHCLEAGKGEREEMLGWWTVAEEKLPVLLPNVSDWHPLGDGTSPLANHPEFYDIKCPSCNNSAKRETDVSDTFLDSAWYYLRYLSVGNNESRIINQESSSKEIENDQSSKTLNDPSQIPYTPEIIKRWCPVAIYIGGAEHSVLHLLYVRFVAMVLHDLKDGSSTRHTRSGSKSSALALEFEEPFPKFFAHGLIVKDGAKMSKSRGNVVIPDKYIEKFGADTLRMYLMFLGQFRDGGDFRDSGIEGMNRFVRRVWNLLTKTQSSDVKTQSLERLRFMHKTIKAVTEDLEAFSYNTTIAKMMEYYNFLSDEQTTDNGQPDSPVKRCELTTEEVVTFLKLMAPFAPHFTEELWARVRGEGESVKSIHFSSWPTYDEKYLVENEIIIPIQLNGKRRGEIIVESSKLKVQSEIENRAKEVIKQHLEGKEVKKVVYVPGKIINFVV